MSIIRLSVPEYLNAFLLSVLIVGFTATPAAAQFGLVIAGAGPINRSMGGNCDGRTVVRKWCVAVECRDTFRLGRVAD